MSSSLNPAKGTVFTGFLLSAFLLAICILGSLFLSTFANGQVSTQVLFLISRLLFWITLFLIYWYCVKKEGQPLLLWQERKHTFPFYFFSGIIVLAIIFAGSTIIHLAAHYLKWSTTSKAISVLLKFGIPLKLFIVITAAVVEELIFRGYLIPRLQLFFKSKWWPIIISSLIFGLSHFRYGTVVNIAGPIFIGFVFAWYYQKYRDIKTLIICHFLIDFIAVMFLKWDE